MSSANSFLSPLSMDRPRARNEGCSGLQCKKKLRKKKAKTANMSIVLLNSTIKAF